MESILPQQPANYGQVISRSLTLYRVAFAKIVFFALLMALIVFIPRLLSDIIGQDIFANIDPLSPHRLWFLAIEIGSLIFFIAILWHMNCVVRGKKEPLVQDVMTGTKKALSVFIASMLQCAIIFAFSFLVYGVLLLLNHLQLLFINSLAGVILTTVIFAGQLLLLLYVSTLFIFQVPLIALENKGILSAIENSVLLVWNHWWRVFSVQATPWIAYLCTLIVFKYILQIDIHIYFTNKSHNEIATTVLNMALFTLFIPWVAAILLSQLKDLELRKQLVPKSKTRKHK